MVIRNIGYLYVIQLLRLCLPLALLSILTHVLSGPQYSVYIYALASSAWLSLLVEYGFNVSATRRIAASKEGSATRAVIVETQSAKWLLVGVTAVFLVWALLWSPVFSGYPEWACCAWLLGVMTGLTPTYYYQATSNLRMAALLEVAGGVLIVAGVFLFLRRGENFWVLCPLLVGVRLGIWQVLERDMLSSRELRYRDLWALRSGIIALKDGWKIFLVQVAASLYTSFNVIMLGNVSTSEAVAVYGSCERLIRSGLTFVSQATAAIFPKLNALKGSDPAKLRRARLLSLAAFSACSFVCVPAIYALAPTIAQMLFHNKLVGLVHVLRIMALVVPAIAISNVLAFHYLVVDHLENVLNWVVFSAVPISLICGYLLSHSYGAGGMAGTWVAIEWYVSAVLLIFVYLRSNRTH